MSVWAISEEFADDDEKLKGEALAKFGLEDKLSDASIDSEWTWHHTKLVPSTTEDRIVVFRPKVGRKNFGVVRVRDKEKVKQWDEMEGRGLWVGRVPAGCFFEAMLVEIKLIVLH